MKYKTQDVEEGKRNNPLLEDIIDLLALVKEFMYAFEDYKKSHNEMNDCLKLATYNSYLKYCWKSLMKLAVCLDSDHKTPTIEVTLAPFDSVKDLKDYEEKLYNMLKEVSENALEEKDVEVMAYLFDMIKDFEHYFCTLDEDNVSRETSSQ